MSLNSLSKKQTEKTRCALLSKAERRAHLVFRYIATPVSAQSFVSLYQHLVLADGTDGQPVQNDAHQRQADCPRRHEAVVIESLVRVHHKISQHQVITHQHDGVENRETDLQHPLPVQENRHQRHYGHHRQYGEQSPRRIVHVAVRQHIGKVCHFTNILVCIETSHGSRHHHHHQDGYYQQINSLYSLYHNSIVKKRFQK